MVVVSDNEKSGREPLKAPGDPPADPVPADQISTPNLVDALVNDIRAAQPTEKSETPAVVISPAAPVGAPNEPSRASAAGA
jgi:hypothetical protein